MNRQELLRQLTDRSYDYCESMGESRRKCKRFAAKTAKTLQNAPMEDLQQFMDEMKTW